MELFIANNLLIGGAVFILSFIVLLALWSLFIRTLFSLLGKSKFYFIPRTLKELFLSIAFVFLLLSVYFSVLFTDRTLLSHEFFKVWQILVIFSLANIVVRVLLTGLDAQYRKAKDGSGIFRSIGLLKGTAGLALYFIALILSINVLSTELGMVITAILLFILVLIFFASYEQIKSIMSGLQLGDYYVEYGKFIHIGDYAGFIESIHGRSTVLRTIDGHMAVIPNSLFFKKMFDMVGEENEMVLLAVVKGSNTDKIKERISAISTKITMSLDELPSEFKPKIFFSSVNDCSNEFSISLIISPESDVRKIIDRFCLELSSEFKGNLVSIKLK